VEADAVAIEALQIIDGRRHAAKTFEVELAPAGVLEEFMEPLAPVDTLTPLSQSMDSATIL
jgi:hypothetical protein